MANPGISSAGDAEARQQRAGDEQLHQQGHPVHRQIDTGVVGGRRLRVGIELAHDRRLLVVQQRAHAHPEYAQQRQPAQQRLAGHQLQAGPDGATHRHLAAGKPAAGLASHRVMAQPQEADHAQHQERGRHQHQVGDAHPLHQRPGQDRAKDRAHRAGRADVAVAAARFGIAEDIGHEAPEHRHREQVEHGDPQEERHPAPGHAAVEGDVEQQQVAMKKPYTVGRNTRRGQRLTSQPYTGCSASMIRNVQVNSTCSCRSFSATPRSAKNAIIEGGNSAATSLDAPIASRTGRST